MWYLPFLYFPGAYVFSCKSVWGVRWFVSAATLILKKKKNLFRGVSHRYIVRVVAYHCLRAFWCLAGQAFSSLLAYCRPFQAFQEEHADVSPESPEFPEIQARFQAMMQEYQTWQKGTMAIQQRLGAEQIETAYRELIEAVDIVAEKRHIDIVTRFVPTSDPFQADSMDLAGEQVRRRVFLRYPDAIDITEAVSAELGL